MKKIGVLAFVAITLILGAPAFAEDDSTGWSESDSHDVLTGAIQKEYMTTGQTLSTWDGTTGHLRLRCKDNELQAFVLFNRYFSMQSSLWYWMDDGRLVGPKVSESAAEGKASFLKAQADVLLFVKIFSEPAARVQIRTPGGREIVLGFETENASKFILRAMTECKM